MFYVYTLKSLSRGTRYVGVSDNVAKRLSEHNKGKCRYTSGRRPWAVLYTEQFATLAEARKREIFLKSGQGRKLLNKILAEAAGSANGRQPGSEPGNLGPNPSPAASVGI